MTYEIHQQAPHENTPLASDAQLARHVPETLLIYRVFVAAQAMSRLVDASVSSSMNLTSRQWRILVVLNRLGTAASGDVARLASFDHSQVSRVATELTKLGLIQRSSDGRDRRKQLLSLTAEGIRHLRMGLPASIEREKRLRARLSDDEYAVVCRALNALTDEASVLMDEICRA